MSVAVRSEGKTESYYLHLGKLKVQVEKLEEGLLVEKEEDGGRRLPESGRELVSL